MTTRWSWLSASRLLLRSVRKCNLKMPGDNGRSWSLSGRSGILKESLFGVLEGLCFALLAEQWLLLIWSEKGRHIHAADCPAVFPMVWNMWAQMSIWAPLIRSHKNCTLLNQCWIEDIGWKTWSMWESSIPVQILQYQWKCL